MITKNNIIPISKMRTDTKAVLKKLHAGQPLYLFSRSTPQAVLLDIDQYEQLEAALEDRLDAQVLLQVGKKELDEAGDFEELLGGK